jgi:hypothetical protein
MSRVGAKQSAFFEEKIFDSVDSGNREGGFASKPAFVSSGNKKARLDDELSFDVVS